MIIKRKISWFLGKDPIDSLDDTSLTLGRKYSTNFTEQQKKSCLNLHYNEQNSYIFIRGVHVYKFKAKDSEINALCLGNVSKDFLVHHIKNTGFYG